MERMYLCIDLKTFYASVECVERHLDPFTTNLVVADPSRGNGAICLAISPAMKAQGVHNRCRIFEIPKQMEYITAIPRMALYIKYAAEVYGIYLKYIAKEDIHVYSIDEAFLDITNYQTLYKMTPKDLAKTILDDILANTGLTATVGIGTNLYLTKIALDIEAKHTEDHMGYLDEELYRQKYWHHRPLTDFWQIGKGIEQRLRKHRIFDMYDIAHTDPRILQKEFGVNSEYLIDHAWGREPCTIAEIKAYHTKSSSINTSQILFEDYSFQDARTVVKEMVELCSLNLVDHRLVCSQIGLSVGYSKDVRAPSGGTMKIPQTTNVFSILLEHMMKLYDRTTDRYFPIRRLSVSFGNLQDEMYEQLDLFTDAQQVQKERNLENTLLSIKRKYGKNTVLRGMDLLEKATTKERNQLIGGHKSGNQEQ